MLKNKSKIKSDQLSISVRELKELVQRMERNDRTAGTISISVIHTNRYFKVWKMNPAELI